MNIFGYLFKIRPLGLALLFLLICCGSGFGQRGSTASIPHFSIQQTNGMTFSYQQLEKGKPFVLIYFSPDCGHCADFTTGLVKNATAFKDKQIVMACWEPLQSLNSFQKKFDFSALPKLKMGSEGYTFFLQQTYQIHYFPFIAIFNGKGQLVEELGNKAGMTDMNLLLSQLKAVRY